MTTHFAHLLDNYLTNTLTSEEEILFSELCKLPENEAVLAARLDADLRNGSYVAAQDDLRHEGIYERLCQLKEESTPVRQLHFLRKWRWVAAAVLILAVGIATAFLLFSDRKNQVKASGESGISSTGIMPGKNGAILTLSDGRQVVLDSLGNGVIAAQNGSEVAIRDGELIYATAGSVSGEMTYNTMITPKGRQFSLQLPDGTKVWLNAASSIRYPTVFAGKNRQVEVNGEAYFEVAKNSTQPFLVMVNELAEVSVLGTSFNISAYNNEEKIITTLIEGSVKVATVAGKDQDANTVILKPGQQSQQPVHVNAIALSSGKSLVVSSADIQQTLAWKNGIFYFKNTDLVSVMKQLERWYDIQVQYVGRVPDFQFNGKMDRGVMLSTILGFLSDYGVKTRLDGKVLIIQGQ